MRKSQRRALLGASLLLAISGLGSLAFVGHGGLPQASAPLHQVDTTAPATTTTVTPIRSQVSPHWLRATTTTWADNATEATQPEAVVAPTEAPPAREPEAQFHVSIPALGAQASAGQGDGSCTTVRITALSPEGCPAPSGDGPIVVHYSGTGIGRNVGKGPVEPKSFAPTIFT